MISRAVENRRFIGSPFWGRDNRRMLTSNLLFVKDEKDFCVFWA